MGFVAGAVSYGLMAECEAGVTEVEVARIERAEHTGSVIRRARTDWPGETC